MKKLFFVSVVAVMVFAVNTSAQVSVGAGYVNETVIAKNATILGENSKGHDWMRTRTHLDGFYIEATYNWDLADVGPGVLALQPGIRYNSLTDLSANSSTKVKYNEPGSPSMTKKGVSRERKSDHFIDIPIHIKYAYDVVPGAFRAFAFAGPVLSLGLVAKEVKVVKTNSVSNGDVQDYQSINRVNAYTGRYYEKTFNEETGKYDVKKGRDDAHRDYTMFDMKLALGVGVTLSEMIDIKFGYNIGLLNRAFSKSKGDIRNSVHSNVLYFGAAYNF